jgi:hypothetical protein
MLDPSSNMQLMLAPPAGLNIPEMPAPIMVSSASAAVESAGASGAIRSLRIVVSKTPGPERPDAAKGDQRSPDAMDFGLASASFAFRANNADIMGVAGTMATHHRHALA